MSIATEREAAARSRLQVLPLFERNWDAEKRHESCSNCRHCVVFDGGNEPLARCEMGHGRGNGVEKPLVFVIRPDAPYVWRAAKDCPDFTCMTDDCEKHNKAPRG